uniref:Ig-like domain-containing protein n=1 Tax=Hippocampus comes TaxID=109280 RepID=A0A3Q2YN63_HIPCM
MVSFGLVARFPLLCKSELLLRPIFLASLAPPTVSAPQHWMALGAASQLECRADGFYPPPVAFAWTRDGQVIQSAARLDGERTADGFYRAAANLTYYPSRWDQNATFGCRVSHNGYFLLLF